MAKKKWITGGVRKPNPEFVQNKLKSPLRYQNWKMSHDLETPQMVYFWTIAPKWHLGIKRLNQQVAQQLESNSPNWHKCLKFTPEKVQKLETYPKNGTKVGNSPHKWHKGSRQVYRLQWLAQCRRSLTESNRLYIQGGFLTGPPLNLLSVGR